MKNLINKKKSTIISILVIIIFSICTILVDNKDKIVTTNAQTLSAKKIEWGVKRNNNHKQPDLGSTNTRILNSYNGIYMGNSKSKKVYLTFDNGYEAGYTSKILEILKQNNVKACFFVTAHYVNSASDLVQRMIDEGHIVGNHTVNHKSMPSLTNEQIKEEVMKLHTSIYEKFGYEMKYIRPPKGEYSESSVAFCKSLGYTTVMWSLAYDDWDENKQGREEYGKKKIIENIHNGAVILLHGTSKDNSNILDSVIKEIKNMGYNFTSLDEYER